MLIKISFPAIFSSSGFILSPPGVLLFFSDLIIISISSIFGAGSSGSAV